MNKDLYQYYKNDNLQKTHGIGQGIEKKIKEYIETGEVKK